MNRVEFGQVIGREMIRRIRVHAPDIIGKESPVYKDGWGALRESMEKSGCEFLGHGNFSHVWTHPQLGDKVVKVCAHAKVDCGAIYLAWARQNTGMPHVPRVHHLEVGHAGLIYFAVLDKMRPLKDATGATQKFINWEHGIDKDSTFAKTARDIREFHSGWCGFDLHDGNAMVDNNGELVITDPLSYFNGTDEQRSNVLSTYQGANA